MTSARFVDYLIIGGGLAGAHCAAELRRLGADGQILLVGREKDPPYERPPLSKSYLTGESSREDALVHPADWYGENGVELRTGTNVLGLDPNTRSASLQGGEEVRFDKALLAPGALVNLLRAEGSGLGGIHHLRAFGNADGIRDRFRNSGRVALIGGSFIAAEVAASLRSQGVDVVMVMPEKHPLSLKFGERVGHWFRNLLQSHGVEVIGEETVESFRGDSTVETLQMASGKSIDAGLAVVGIGARPDTMLAGRAGLELEDGIACDARLQTSAAGIFAAGDACSYFSSRHGRRIRVEHWDSAIRQGRHAASAMLGSPDPYTAVPYFFSDLADWASLEFVGTAGGWTDEIWRGDPSSGEFSVWYLDGGTLMGVLSVGCPADLEYGRRLLEADEPIESQLEEIVRGGHCG